MMKKILLMITSLLMTSMLFAQEVHVLDNDALNIAGLLTKKSVMECINKITLENKTGGLEFSPEKISESEVDGRFHVVITGSVLQGGDIRKASSVVEIEYGPDSWSPLKCTTRTNWL